MDDKRPYIYALIDKRMRYWTGCGWSLYRDHARRFETEAEAEAPLRKMMLDHIHAKMGPGE